MVIPYFSLKYLFFSEKIQLSEWGPVPIDSHNWSSTVHHITPKWKGESMELQNKSSPCVRKFKQMLLLRKVMTNIFWDGDGILLIEFVPYGQIKFETVLQAVEKNNADL